MPNRILREGILTSPKLAKLNWAEEVLYRRLMSVVDDYGRYPADEGILLGHLYSRQLKKVSESDIGKWLDGVQAAGLVRVYRSESGEHYLELLNFGQKVRALKSKYPDPPTSAGTCQQPLANASVFVFGDVSEDEGDAGAAAPTPKPSKKKPKTAIPADFAISDRVKAWATENGFDRIPQHLDAFRLKVAANGYTYADWDAAFMGAVRDDWAKIRVPQRFSQSSPASTVAENPQVAETKARLEADARRKIATPAEIAAIKAVRVAGVTQ